MQQHRLAELAVSETCATLFATLKMVQTTLAMFASGVQLPELSMGRPATPLDLLIYLCRTVLDESNRLLVSKVGIVFKQLADSDKTVFFKLIPIMHNKKKGWVTPLQLAALCDNTVMFRAILAEIHRMSDSPALSPLSIQMELYSEAARAAILHLSPLHCVVLNANDSLICHVLSQCLCNDKTARAVARSEHTLVHAIKEAKACLTRHASDQHAVLERTLARLDKISTHLSTFYNRVSRESQRERRPAVVDQLLLAAASSFHSSPLRCSDSPTRPHSPYAERCN